MAWTTITYSGSYVLAETNLCQLIFINLLRKTTILAKNMWYNVSNDSLLTVSKTKLRISLVPLLLPPSVLLCPSMSDDAGRIIRKGKNWPKTCNIEIGEGSQKCIHFKVLCQYCWTGLIDMYVHCRYFGGRKFNATRSSNKQFQVNVHFRWSLPWSFKWQTPLHTVSSALREVWKRSDRLYESDVHFSRQLRLIVISILSVLFFGQYSYF